MDLMSYQLEPAQMALNKTRQRILIADTVGLGKTLEAGILMSELIARGKGKRILVVTVKSMMTQFQKEMWNRFTIPLVRLDSSRIQSVRAKLPTNYNPFFYYDKTIISVDTLKNDLDYRTHLENAWWDIIVIDEAHNVAKRGDKSSQRSKLASLLANRSDTLIMLTATPHDGKGQSVASLMNMLDPTAIADEENYTKDDIEGLLIRRFKKDIQDQVSGAFKERVITIERCAASAREEAAYDIFADMKLQMDESRTRGKGILFKTSLEKSLFSSPAACIKSIDARIRKLEKKYPDGDMPDIVTLKELKAALELISPADFSRYAKLLKLLNSTEYGWSPSKNNDRLVIFTERIYTMRYLAENIKKDLGLKDNQLEVMHGGMSDKELQETSVERNKQLEKNTCRLGYFREYEGVTGIQSFINSKQNYFMLQGLQANLYECFLPIAINNTNKTGVFAFIHPETIFNDSNAVLIREIIYPKLRKHFRFSNALKLFAEVHSSREFGLNVFSNNETNNFENIFNLYTPSTIDEAYVDMYPLELLAMKNDAGERELRGNKSRIIDIGEIELRLLAKVVDNI